MRDLDSRKVRDMQISALANNGYRNNVSFGFNIYGDCGASIPEGSIKMKLDPKGEMSPFDLEPGVVCPKGIINVEDFLGGVATNIAEAVKGNLDKLPEDDKELENVVLVIPAQTKANRVSVISNLKASSTKDSLRDIDFNHIPSLLAARGVNVSDNFKLVVANDMYGAVSGVLNKVLEDKEQYKDLLKPGSTSVIVMPGGGLGVGRFEVDEGKIRIIAEESGHIITEAKGKCLEADAASVPALIGNFAQALGLSEKEKETLVKTGNAKIPTQYPICMEDSSEEYDKLMKTDLFEHTKSEDGKAYLLLKKDGKPITTEEFSEASKYSVGKFVDDIAKLCAIKIDAKAKSAILTGKLIDKINKDIAHIPAFEGKNIQQLVMEKIPEYLDSWGNHCLMKINLELFT